METLLQIDLVLFRILNNSLANPVFDAVMPFITEVKHWYPVYILLFLWLLLKGGVHGRWCALVLAVTILCTDQFNSHVLKVLVGRIRPCASLEFVRLLVPCGAGKSFPSSHAVNNIAAAFILGSYYPTWKKWVYPIAGLVALSRVYVGVHFPFDILGGAIEGVIMAWILLTLTRLIIRRFSTSHPNQS